MNKIVGSFRFILALLFALACILLVLFYLQWIKPEAKRKIIRTWARSFINMIGMRFSVEGDVYKSHCLIVANHISHETRSLYRQKRDRRLACIRSYRQGSGYAFYPEKESPFNHFRE